jgi:HSP20 family molecular chaperone IbpA
MREESGNRGVARRNEQRDVRREERREDEFAIAPPVDIFEDAQGITVQAEMPGVSKDTLNVRADRNGLLIEGEATIDMPENMDPLYADLQCTRYRRNFSLSGEFECERIEAHLKDGVLTVHIPKRAEFRPRRIEVQAQ